MTHPVLRRGALVANLAYVASLLLAAYNLYVEAHRPPTGPLADWAAFDAALNLMLAATVVTYAVAHLIATWRWWKGRGAGCVVAMTLPLAGLLTLFWLMITLPIGFGNTNEPGWLVIGAALVAAALTGREELRRRPASN